jgi:hypothetical protein
MPYNKHYNLYKSVMVSGVLIVFLTIAPWVDASEATHGEIRAAIRSANFPCAHVINLESTGDNTWVVKCNSGKFRVTRDQNNKFTVSQIE